VTLTGLALGLLSALALLLASRLADGLDGAVARATRRTDFGGYLDITADFVVYSALPLAFALRDPAANGAAAAFVLASFYVNGASFLGFAILAEKRGLRTQARGLKSLYFSAGLMEGTETILFLALICLAPGLFAPAAWVFGALCLLGAALRLAAARRAFPGGGAAG
jgi:phosphatidylglycerophosphate synthase